MEEWAEKLLPKGCQGRTRSLLKSWGVNETDIPPTVDWLLEKAALCRLALAPLKESSNFPAPSHPIEGVISISQSGLSRGRPITAWWAFWAAYIVQQRFGNQGKPPTYKFLTPLIGILVKRRNISAQEVRSKFVELRKEARAPATIAAQEILDKKLEQRLGEHEFAQGLRAAFEGAHYPPIALNGKIDEPWLARLLQTRSMILDHVKKGDLLAGREPVVNVGAITRVAHQTWDLSDRPAAVIHLEKGKDIPVPRLPDTERTLSVSIPRSHLENPPPHAAKLYALPAWAPLLQKLHFPGV